MTERSRKTQDEQGRKFVDAARALGCDESEELFDAALKKVAAHKRKGVTDERDQEGKPSPLRQEQE
jgi:hypothetical protein